MFAEWPLNIYPSPSNVESKVLENISGKYLIFAQYLVNIVLFCGAQCRNSWCRGGGGLKEVSKMFFSHEILIFLLLGSNYKISEPYHIYHSGLVLKFAHFPVKIGLIGGGGQNLPCSHRILIFLL